MDGDAGGFSWSGGYAGVLLGYGSGRSTAITDGFVFNRPARDRVKLEPSGFVGGVVAGYNFERGRFVYGAEAEAGYLGAQDGIFNPGYFPTPGNFPDTDYHARTDYGFYGSLAGRIGFAFDRTLLSLRGGAILARIDYGYGDLDFGPGSSIVIDPNNSVIKSETRLGFVIGASLEHAFTDKWVGRVDYSYADFGSHRETDSTGENYDISDHLHMIRAGISYKF